MLVSAIVAVYMVNEGFGYWSLVGMNLTRALIRSILLISFFKCYPKWLFSIESFKKLFSFGSNLLIAGVIATIVENLYSILIGRYFNAAQVGYFQQSYKCTNILSSTLSSITKGITYPLMTSIQEDKNRLVQVYIKVMGVVTLVTFPAFFWFCCYFRRVCFNIFR
jgi:teichuronic acid exporter